MLALPAYREPDYLDLIGWREKEEQEEKWRREVNETMKAFDEDMAQQRIRDAEMMIKWRVNFYIA